MDNLVNETNSRLTEIINDLTTIKNEYEEKLKANSKEIDAQLEKVQKYKTEFFESKAKIEKMNSDIEGFETDYQKLVERFKDDELVNILIAANKEISLKIDERKRKIVKDKNAMNELVDKAENVKSKLVKLTAEKKALELCLNKILDSYNYYANALGDIIDYSSNHKGNLCGNMPDESLDDNSYETVNESVENSYIDMSDDNDFSMEDNSEDLDNYDEFDQEVPPIEETEKEAESMMDDEEDIDDEDDEDTEALQPVDISDMVKDETEVSDYDNEEVVEGNEHKIVIEEEKVDSFVQDKDKNDKKDKKEKKKDKEEDDEDISIDVDFDDSLEDDDSLYE